MKKTTHQLLQRIVILLTLVSLATSAASLPLATSFSTNQNNGNSNDSKINTILDMINATLIREYLETLVGFGPRMTGTYGCEKAAEYIHEQFTDMGLTARYQNWTSWGNYYYHHIYQGQNIEGTLQGTNTTDDPIIIFNAHYDSVAEGPGANDDGSGTVAVLAAAYALSHFTFNKTIKFVAFAGEEVALIGSRAYAKEAYERNDSILVEINADMIGHDEGGKQMTVTATEDAGWVADIFQQIKDNHDIPLTVNRGVINRVHHKLTGSDYAPFIAYGWEAIGCWGGDHDPNFHSALDNLSNVNISYLVNTTRLIAGTLAVLADIPDTPPQVRITSPRVGILYREGMKKRDIGEFKTTVINDIWIWAEIQYGTAPVKRAEFYYDGTLVFTDTEAPFTWHFNKFSLGKHDITVIVYDHLDRNSTDWRDIRFINLLLKR